MGLNFVKNNFGYTFDDVLLVPKHSTIKSRKEVDLSVSLGNDVNLSIPVINANMKHVASFELCLELARMGGLALLHRFSPNPVLDQLNLFQKLVEVDSKYINYVGVSIGIQQYDLDNISTFISNGVKIVCIDVAHADSDQTVKVVDAIKSKYGNKILLIVGNVAVDSGAANLAKAGADVIKINIGSGCFAAGTRILLSNGLYKNIEDIKIGDRVINKDGNPVNVTNVFCTGIKKVVKIRHGLNSKHTYVTGDHNYWVGDINTSSRISSSYSKILDKQSKTTPRASKYKWKSINDLKYDVFLMPRYINFELNTDFSLDIIRTSGGSKKMLEYTLKPNYDLGYILGTFLGDGCATQTIDSSKLKLRNVKSFSGSIFWYFHKNEIDIVEKLSISIKKILNKNVKLKYSGNIIIVALHYKPLANILYKFGKKYNKKLPDELFVNNKEYLNGIVDGLIDSDGSVEKCGRIKFGNTSESIHELFNIAAYLTSGIFPNCSISKPSIGGLKNCNIGNCHESYRSEIINTGKKRLTENYQASKLLELTECDIELPVYDITVDCDTHSFIANNAIVHNSICSTRIETGNGVPALTALSNVFQHMEEYYPNVKLIADGGLRDGGSITKALVFSHCVMLGNLLARSNEAPGESITHNGHKYKMYAGSSTFKNDHVEGVSGKVPCEGPVKNIIEKLLQGVRSGCSYQNAKNLEELKINPQFILVTNNGLVESRPHSLLINQ